MLRSLQLTIPATLAALLAERTLAKPFFTNYWTREIPLNIGECTLAVVSASTPAEEIASSIESRKWNEANGYKRLSAAESYITSKTGLSAFIIIKPETYSACIIVRNLNFGCAHLVASFLPLYFPKLFAEQPLKPEEKELLSFLVKSDADAYLAAMMDYGKKLGLEEKKIRELLLNFEKQAREAKVSKAQEEVSVQRDRVEHCSNDYLESLRELDRLIMYYEGARLAVENASEDKELMEYFLSHKNLKLLSVGGGTMEFIVSGFLDQFDMDGYENFSKHEDIYRNIETPAGSPFRKIENRKLFMDAIFNEDPKLKIRICGYYKLMLDGDVRSACNYNYGRYAEFAHCLPNPHLDIHRCIGNNGPLIIEQLRRGEIMGAVECCAASVAAVNIHETGMTFRPFLGHLMSAEKPCIYNTVTGEDQTPLEALAWLVENKGETK